MLELFKPFWILKNKDNPVMFNEAGIKFSEWANINNQKMRISDEHPFVIFYDDQENCYYYLKARSALNKKKEYREKFEGEIKVKDSQYDGLFRNESYIDCSQIFKMNKDELESLIDLEADIHIRTDKLDDYDIKNILNAIAENIMQIPPFLSILEVKLNENDETYAKSLYLCNRKIDLLDSQDISDILYLDPLYSNKDNEFLQNRNRYQNGINFCKLFLNEYFPDLIHKFELEQGLEPKYSLKQKNGKHKLNLNDKLNDHADHQTNKSKPKNHQKM